MWSNKQFRNIYFFLNVKNYRPEDKEFHNQLIDIVRYAQNLENIVKYKNREIERLQYLIKYLTIAQQKRDEMLSHIQEENRKFKQHMLISKASISGVFREFSNQQD